jgi:indolepyruvate ferredoxin oxidoreductase, alpha subunit
MSTTTKRALLSGNEAIARGAWEAGVTFASGYPGTPSTEILESARAYGADLYCEWSPNEKVAMEVAAGASLAGARAIVTMKHVGLNVAADPLMTLSYIGTVGGLVVISADDPGMHSSQNEQDTRHYARFGKVPVLEPSDSQEAKDFVSLGLAISEKHSTPVILRTTTRVSHSSSVVSLGDRLKGRVMPEFQKNPQRFVPIPLYGRSMRLRVEERTRALAAEACSSPANRIEWGDRGLGVIAEGIAYQYVKEILPEASVLKIGWPWPFPDDLLRSFAAGVKRLLIVEELDGIMEEHVRSLGIACEGHDLVPAIGELSPDILAAALRKSVPGVALPARPVDVKQAALAADLPARPPVLCPACPHRGVFFSLGKLDVIVTGDIGCYSLGVFPPLKRIDTILCMGGGISMAHGMQKAREPRPNSGADAPSPGKPIVGIVGDSTFFHSGITGLLDIAYNRGAATIIVADNRTTAMTGHQEHPGTGRTLLGEPTNQASIEEIGRACGIRNIATVNPYDLKATTEILRKAVESPEPWLVVTRAPCPLYLKKNPGLPRRVNQDLCRKCKACLRLGCPAIEWVDGAVRVNELLCGGCGMCGEVCEETGARTGKPNAFFVPKPEGACNE